MDLRTPDGRQELGRRIHAAVAGAGHDSLAAFAEALGCSRALIYQYVNGNVLVQLDRLQSIASLTGKPLGWFFSDDPNGVTLEVQQLRSEAAAHQARVQELEQALTGERGARLKEAWQHRQALVETLRELCLAYRRLGDARAILEVGPRWLAVARENGDEQGALEADLQMGHAWYQTGDTDRAGTALQRVVARAAALEEQRLELSARQELVRVFQASGRTEEARQQALQLAGKDVWWHRWAGLVAVAAIAEQVGDLEESEARLAAAATVVEEGDAPDSQRAVARAYIESNRVNVLLARGRYAEALRESEALRLAAEEASLPDQMRECALNVAICHLRSGNYGEAGQGLARLAAWAEVAGDRRLSALTKVFEAERRRRSGDVPGAKQSAREAMEEATGLGSGHVLGEAELALGEACLAGAQADDARYHLTRCLRRAGKLQLRKLAVAARLALARVAEAEGDESAPQAFQQAAREASAAGYEDLHAEAVAAGAATWPEHGEGTG
jgi:tetratricopeptide (TPR) repeat protein